MPQVGVPFEVLSSVACYQTIHPFVFDGALLSNQLLPAKLKAIAASQDFVCFEELPIISSSTIRTDVLIVLHILDCLLFS